MRLATTAQEDALRASAYHYARNLGEDIDIGEASDFSTWFWLHWPNRDVATAWQAWLSALGTLR